MLLIPRIFVRLNPPDLSLMWEGHSRIILSLFFCQLWPSNEMSDTIIPEEGLFLY